jgi:hypothetical protein
MDAVAFEETGFTDFNARISNKNELYILKKEKKNKSAYMILTYENKTQKRELYYYLTLFHFTVFF